MFLNRRPFYVEKLEQDNDSNGDEKSPAYYKATLDRDVWQKPGQTINRRTVTFERIMGSIGIDMDYDLIYPVEHPGQIWIAYTPGVGDAQPLTPEYLNRCIKNDMPLALRMTRSREYPGMVVAHRVQAIGSYAVSWIKEAPGIENACLMAPQPATNDAATMYGSHTLMAAFVEPEASIRRAEQMIRYTLTV